MEIILDTKRLTVSNIISRTELLRLAGISEEMEKKSIEAVKSAGTGWEVWRRIIGETPDEQLKSDEVINLTDEKYRGIFYGRTFFTGCNNTTGG